MDTEIQNKREIKRRYYDYYKIFYRGPCSESYLRELSSSAILDPFTKKEDAKKITNHIKQICNVDH